MDREVVVSVSVRAIGYDVETSTLEIEFCDSSIYQYSGVPEGSLCRVSGFYGLESRKDRSEILQRTHKRTIPAKDGT